MKPFLNILILPLFLISCTGNQDIRFNSGNQGLSLSLNAPSFKSPVELIPKADSGLFFFDTREGRTWISTRPQKQAKTDSGMHFTWNKNSRAITLDIAKGDDYHLVFRAEPADGILGWGINVRLTPDEFITGLFERTVDGKQNNSWTAGIREAMNLRGQSMDMIIKPTLSLYCPFYLSSNNYGMFVDGTWPGHYDIGKEQKDLLQVRFDGPFLSLTFSHRGKHRGDRQETQPQRRSHLPSAQMGFSALAVAG